MRQSRHHLFEPLAVEVLDRAHELRFRASGGSMAPMIRHGDILRIRDEPVALGDVVLARCPGDRLVAHRIVRSNPGHPNRQYWLQGDHAPVPDGEIGEDDIIGRVVAVERDGRLAHLDTGLHLWFGRLLAWSWPIGPRAMRTMFLLTRRLTP